jgi:galactokinase
VRILKSVDHNLSPNTIKANELNYYRPRLNEGLFGLLEGTIINREITWEATAELSKQFIDYRMMEKLLNEHQKFFRDVLRISTFKINRMIDAA